VKRRTFITLLGGAATWPLAAPAQGERVRRIGVMPPGTENDSETRARLVALRQGLELLGWKEGHNIQFEYRWTSGNPELIRRHAAELVALAPDLLVTGITPAV
jgi:putative ABC transport system substrate-binding protein